MTTQISKKEINTKALVPVEDTLCRSLIDSFFNKAERNSQMLVPKGHGVTDDVSSYLLSQIKETHAQGEQKNEGKTGSVAEWMKQIALEEHFGMSRNKRLNAVLERMSDTINTANSALKKPKVETETLKHQVNNLLVNGLKDLGINTNHVLKAKDEIEYTTVAGKEVNKKALAEVEKHLFEKLTSETFSAEQLNAEINFRNPTKRPAKDILASRLLETYKNYEGGQMSLAEILKQGALEKVFEMDRNVRLDKILTRVAEFIETIKSSANISLKDEKGGWKKPLEERVGETKEAVVASIENGLKELGLNGLDIKQTQKSRTL